MRRALSIAAVALAAAGLSACERNDRPVAGLCKAFPAANAQPVATDGAAVVEDCLHRWAYTLAGGRDAAGDVADAVVAACSGPLARWNQQTLGQAAAAGGQPEPGQSLLTGETVTPIAQHAAFASDRALFYVVQARAGGCKPPPRREGQPAMTSPDR
jgi:hypothetical protein